MCQRAQGQVSTGPAYNVAAGHSHFGPPPGEWVWRVEKAQQDRPWVALTSPEAVVCVSVLMTEPLLEVT